MLDSSPVPLPPVPRPLKRSASTASLPTPPRTRHKRKHVKKSDPNNDATDEDSGSASEVEESPKRAPNKKRRTGDTEKVEDEDAFWLGSPSSRTRSKTASTGAGAGTSTNARSPSASPAPPILLRRRQQQQQKKLALAPMSPPPSNRKATTAIITRSAAKNRLIASPTFTSPPTTPKRNRPQRDSPNNPFLMTPSEVKSSGSTEDGGDSPGPSGPRTPLQEKPTVTYVFRGVRGVFPNPHYNHAKGRAASPPANSLLPINHPDYSPDTHCLPKLLFPTRRTRGAKRAAAATAAAAQKSDSNNNNRRSVSPDATVSEEEYDVARELKPMVLNFGDPVKPRVQLKTLAEEGVGEGSILPAGTTTEKGGNSESGVDRRVKALLDDPFKLSPPRAAGSSKKRL